MRGDIETELGRSADAYLSAAPPGAYVGLKRWVDKVKPSRSQATAAG